MQQPLTESRMEKAFFDADPEFDGLFYTGVKTTGIFCKPSCRARKPLRKNIAFFPTVAAAMDSGFRACKKCRPLESKQTPDWFKRLRAEIDAQPQARIRDCELTRFGVDPATDRKSTRLNSSHTDISRMPSSA